MGFLLGAFGKLAAGSRYRSLQARMMRIQSKLRRASRDVANMEKMLDRNKKAELQALTNNTNAQKTLYQNSMQYVFQSGQAGKIQAALAQYYEAGSKEGEYNGIKIDEKTAQGLTAQITQESAKFNSQVSSMTAWVDTNIATMKQEIEDKYERLRDSMLEPLKDEEDSLQLEKDTLESQLTIAKQDYEACQKMEQADAKMLAPNYTGGQA